MVVSVIDSVDYGMLNGEKVLKRHWDYSSYFENSCSSMSNQDMVVL
ncbi:MAG: hypothetical protein H6Q67_848 [Firmicutes bacterium]|nr:hypothetical protein [Bacillota bacterium]